jgi:hypothetical protein
MRKVILYMITTLDGLIAGPDDALAHYEPSDEEHRFANDLFGRAGAILFGRVAYEGFAAAGGHLRVRLCSSASVSRADYVGSRCGQQAVKAAPGPAADRRRPAGDRSSRRTHAAIGPAYGLHGVAPRSLGWIEPMAAVSCLELPG